MTSSEEREHDSLMPTRKETRQIKEAFIDGFLSAKGTEGNGNRARALAAWKNENTTEYPPKTPKNTHEQKSRSPGEE